MTSRKVYPVHTIFRHEKLGSNRAIPISDVRLYWVRNGATASLEDVDDQPLYTDEKELPESTACAQGLVDVPIHWISPAGREILFNDNVLSRWTIKETSGLRLYVSFRYWIFHFRDDRHGSEDSLILHSRECYPDFQVRKYRVMNMEINTLYASLPCLNRAEIFSAIKNVCLRTRDDDINRTPKWLIDELFDRRELGLSPTRDVVELLIASYASHISRWLNSDVRQKPHFPKRGLFDNWTRDMAPYIQRNAGNNGRPRLPAIVWSLRHWMEERRWNTRELQRMADRGPFVPQRPPGNRPKPRNPTAPRDDAIIIDSDDEAEARRGSQGPGPSNDATMYELFGTPSPSPGPDPRVTLPPVPVPPPTDPETRTRRASNIYQWECRKRLPKHLQQWYETPPSTLGRTWWKCPLLNLELAQVEAQCHLRLDFTSNRFTNDLYALLHPTTASHLRTAITNPPGFFEMDFLKKIGYNVWDRALQEVTRHHNRWHLWGYRVGVLYESSDWGKGEEYVKLEELSEAELAHVKSQLKSCTLFYRDENDDQEVIDVVPRLPASFWDVKHSEWSQI